MPAEGRRRAAEYINAHPEASLREVARETDVSLGTVHDVRERIAAEQIMRREHRPGPRRKSRTVRRPPPRRFIRGRSGSSTGLGARNAQRLAWPAISVKLTADPALRYTDGGRAFLRWMALHSMQPDEWREFIDAIPQHWLKEVSRVAVSMSEEWQQFADRLGTKLEAAS